MLAVSGIISKRSVVPVIAVTVRSVPLMAMLSPRCTPSTTGPQSMANCTTLPRGLTDTTVPTCSTIPVNIRLEPPHSPARGFQIPPYGGSRWAFRPQHGASLWPYSHHSHALTHTQHTATALGTCANRQVYRALCIPSCRCDEIDHVTFFVPPRYSLHSSVDAGALKR